MIICVGKSCRKSEQTAKTVSESLPVNHLMHEEDLLGMIHYNLEVMDADRNGQSPYDYSPTAIAEIRKIKAILDRDES